MNKKDENFTPGSLGYHEALHLVSTAVSIWEEHIHNHPVIQNDEKAMEQSEKIGLLIAELYQYLGENHFK